MKTFFTLSTSVCLRAPSPGEVALTGSLTRLTNRGRAMSKAAMSLMPQEEPCHRALIACKAAGWQHFVCVFVGNGDAFVSRRLAWQLSGGSAWAPLK